MSTIITDNPYTFTVEDNMNINAVFEDNTYTINAYMFNTTSMAFAGALPYPSTFTGDTTKKNFYTTGSGVYTPGQSCTLNATIVSGHGDFRGWYDIDTGECVSTSKSFTFTPTKSSDLYAVFGGNDLSANGGKYVSLTRNYATCTFNLRGTSVDGTTATQSKTINSNNITAEFTSLPLLKDLKYLDFLSISSQINTYSFPNNVGFNLIHDENHPLKAPCIFNEESYNSTLGKTICIWKFGPRETTIYLDSEYPFKGSNNSSAISELLFTSHNAPNFNIKLNCINPNPDQGSYTDIKWIYVPNDGVGYNNDWIDANFTYNTRPTIYKIRLR